eukprot:g3816.t1
MHTTKSCASSFAMTSSLRTSFSARASRVGIPCQRRAHVAPKAAARATSFPFFSRSSPNDDAKNAASPSVDIEKKMRNPTPLGLIADEREIEELIGKSNYVLQDLDTQINKNFNNPEVEFTAEDVPEMFTGMQDQLQKVETNLMELKQRIGILGDDANTLLQRGAVKAAVPLELGLLLPTFSGPERAGQHAGAEESDFEEDVPRKHAMRAGRSRWTTANSEEKNESFF